MFGTQNTQAS